VPEVLRQLGCDVKHVGVDVRAAQHHRQRIAVGRLVPWAVGGGRWAVGG
jgi:hypothetical protein